MNWSDYFSDWMYEKGEEIAKLGRVQVNEITDELIVANVKDKSGNKKHVVISFGRTVVMSCSCPISTRGGRCEHEAAVFYVHENPEVLYQSSNTKKAVKKKKSDESTGRKNGYVVLSEEFGTGDTGSDDYRSGYSYFKFDKILKDKKIKNQLLDEAKSLLKNNEITVSQLDEGYYGYDRSVKVLRVSGHLTGVRGATRNTYVVFSKNELLECSCGAPGCTAKRIYRQGYYMNDLCKHSLALLVYAHDKLMKTNELTLDATNWKAQQLLSEYHKIDRRDAIDSTESAADVTLEPRLEKDGYGNPELGFKIGIDKLYILKSLSELEEAVEHRDSIKLGKSTEISFGQHTFTAASQPYYDLIKNYRKEAEDFGRQYYYVADDKTIPVEAHWLDDIYDLIRGKRVEYKPSRERARYLNVEDGEYRPHLTINSIIEDGEVEGISVFGTIPEFMEGQRHKYIISEDSLSRISEKSSLAIEPLLSAQNGSHMINMEFGRNTLGAFYNSLLPRLSEFCDIDNLVDESVEAYVPPEVMFRFYFDANEDNIMLGIEAVYDDEVFVMNPFEDIKETYRDAREEFSVINTASQLFEAYDEDVHVFHCARDEDKIYHILEYGVTEFMALGEVNATDSFKRLRIRRDMKLTLGVSLSAGLLMLDIQTDDMSQDELIDILYSYQKKKKYHRLKNGDFISLEDDNTAMLSMLLNDMGVSPKEFVKGKMNLPAYRAVYLDAMLQSHEEVATERDVYFKNTIRQISSIRNSEVKPPKTLRNILRKYQLYGFRFLRVLSENNFGGILADDMGLGKTIQVLALLLTAKEQGESGTSIVICPASLVYNWLDEAQRFTPELKVAALAGTPAEREEMLSNISDYDLLVTSYGLMTRDVVHYEDLDFNYQIIDEAQYIKNARTGAAKAVRLVHAAHRVALTGTPIENRLSELWSIFDFLMPGFLFGYEEFRRRFETPIAVHRDSEASERLRQMISPFVLRRLKKDVLKDLPDKLEESRTVPLPDAQRKLYDGQVVNLQKMLAESDDAGFDKSKIQILAEITKLRQICCDPSLLYNDYKKESGKREALSDLVNEAIDGGHKMLIFSQFTSMLDLIQADMEKSDIGFYRIDGSTSKKERVRLVNDFNRNDIPVFLISLKAGGTGLNLTGADVVIHYDPWWNIAVQNQATDRAHRIGQENVVSVFKLIAKNTIEEKIAKLQETKKELADEILSGEGGSLATMSREDLLDLLG